MLCTHHALNRNPPRSRPPSTIATAEATILVLVKALQASFNISWLDHRMSASGQRFPKTNRKPSPSPIINQLNEQLGGNMNGAMSAIYKAIKPFTKENYGIAPARHPVQPSRPLQESRLRHRCHSLSSAGHRRQHDDLQRDQRGHVPAPALR